MWRLPDPGLFGHSAKAHSSSRPCDNGSPSTPKTLTDQTPAGRQKVRTLDAQGRVVQVQPAGLEPTSFAYDLRGRLATVTQGTGPAARTSTFGYDLQDRLVKLTDPLGRTVGFAYDPADRVTSQTLPDGRQIGLSYDGNGNVTSITPHGQPAHGFGYTPVNLEASYSPPALDATSPTTTYAYNTDRQPTLVTRPDGQTLSLGYDAGGRLATLTQPRGVTNLAYHPTTGQLTTLTAPDGGTLAYTYDGALVTSETWGGPAGAVTGSVNRTYDSDFRVAAESVNGANPITFGYDPDSLLTQAGAWSACARSGVPDRRCSRRGGEDDGRIGKGVRLLGGVPRPTARSSRGPRPLERLRDCWGRRGETSAARPSAGCHLRTSCYISKIPRIGGIPYGRPLGRARASAPGDRRHRRGDRRPPEPPGRGGARGRGGEAGDR